jgi:phospholipid-binding lipoprotein MlaA
MRACTALLSAEEVPPRMPATMRVFTVMLVALLAGCATAPGRTTGDDRWESFNRGVYKFNDVVDRATLKPVAKGYKKITPHWMRVGIANFLSNLDYPATVLNQFLQGKPLLGLRDTGRFLLNSTLGVAGFLDVATAVGLEANDEDFGQTLAVWGVGSGPYLTLPFFGPSSLRDAPARIIDPFSDPLAYADIPWEALWAKRGLDAVHSRAELLPLDATLQRTYDPYAFIRDAWVQQREFAIFDGNPPPEVLDEEFLEEEEPAAESPEKNR